MRFLFVDRIIEQIPGQVSRGIKHITPDDHFLYPEDSGQASFIPSLIGETLGQLAAWNVMAFNDFTARPVAGIVDSVVVHRQALLGETLLLESFIEAVDEQAVQYNSHAYVGDALVLEVKGAIGPLLPMNDFIARAQVVQQFKEIDRPEDWQAVKTHYIQEAAETALDLDLCAPPSLFFDQILAFEPGDYLTATKKISRAAGYFADHFPNKPVLPMTILLECKINLAKAFIEESGFEACYEFQSFRKIKMNEFVYPGDQVLCQLKLGKKTEQTISITFRSTVNQKRVCVAEAIFSLRS